MYVESTIYNVNIHILSRWYILFTQKAPFICINKFTPRSFTPARSQIKDKHEIGTGAKLKSQI